MAVGVIAISLFGVLFYYRPQLELTQLTQTDAGSVLFYGNLGLLEPASEEVLYHLMGVDIRRGQLISYQFWPLSTSVALILLIIALWYLSLFFIKKIVARDFFRFTQGKLTFFLVMLAAANILTRPWEWIGRGDGYWSPSFGFYIINFLFAIPFWYVFTCLVSKIYNRLREKHIVFAVIVVVVLVIVMSAVIVIDSGSHNEFLRLYSD